MKLNRTNKVVATIFISTLFASCAINYIGNDYRGQDYSYVINSDFEKIDTSVLNGYERKFQKRDMNVQERQAIFDKYHISGGYELENFFITIYDSSGNKKESIKKVVESGSTSPVYFYRKFIDRDSIIFLNKVFFSDGKIREKSLTCRLGFAIGKKSQFDEAGILKKSLDTDSGYKVSYLQVLNFCKKRRIYVLSENLNQSFPSLAILKNFYDEPKRIWVIQHRDFLSHKEIIYTVNGITGKIHKKAIPLMLPTED